MEDLSEVQGLWWNPLSREQVSRGTLALNDGEPILTYDYRSYEPDTDPITLGDTVHGVLDDGRKVSLWDWRIGGPVSTKEHITERNVTVDIRTFTHAVFGAHCESIDKSQFDAARVRFKHLKTLLRTEEVLDLGAQAPPSGTASFVWGDENPCTLYVSLHDRPLLEYWKGFPKDEPSPCFSRFPGDNAAVVFSCDKPISYEVYEQLLYNMQLLTAFTYQAALPRTSWEIRLPDSNEWLPVVTTQSVKTPTNRSQFFPQSLVISGEDTAPELVVARWFEAVNEMYPLPQILAIPFLNPGGVLEAKLLIGLAALEKAHSILGFNPERFRDHDLSLLKKTLKKAMKQWLSESSKTSEQEQEYRAWLSESLHNRKTFSISLAETLTFLESSVLDALGIYSEKWIPKVRHARNTLAHTASHVPRPDSAGGPRIRLLDLQNRALLSLLVRKWMVGSTPKNPSIKFIFPELAHRISVEE